MGVKAAKKIRRRIAALPEPYRSNFDIWLRECVGPLERASKVRLAEARELLQKVEDHFGRFGEESAED